MVVGGIVVVVVVVGGIVVVVVVVVVVDVVVVVGGIVVVVVVVVVGGIVVVVGIVVMVVVVVGDRVVVVAGGRVVVVGLLVGRVEEPLSAGLLSASLSSSSPPSVVEGEDWVVAGLVDNASCSPRTSTPVKDPRLSTKVDSEVPVVELNTATTTAARTPMASRVIKMTLAASFMGSPAIGILLTHSPCRTLPPLRGF